MNVFSRRRRLAALLAALLAPGNAALACRYCGVPPPPEPPAETQAPSAPFDLRGNPELTERELAGILKDARYQKKDAYLEDTQAADPERHLLRPKEVLELLGKVSRASVEDLREEASEGRPLPRESFLLANHLYWQRGPLLPAADRRDLAVWISRRGEGSPQSPAAQPRQQASDDLKDQFIGLMRYTGTVEEGRALRAIGEKMLESPTARELARKFVDRGNTFTIRFEDMPNSLLQEKRGKMVFNGTRAYTSTASSPMEIAMNRFFMRSDPEHLDAASILAHELLGHALRNAQAQEKGLGYAMERYINDETNARLVGWVVKGELGGKLDDHFMWDYLASPAQYYQSLGTTDVYYAKTLSRAQMGDPAGVYRERVKQSNAKIKRYAQWKKELETDAQDITHFISHPDHRLEAASFKTLREETKNLVESIPKWVESWEKIVAQLTPLIAYYQGQDGADTIATLQSQAQDPLFDDIERNMTVLGGKISKLAKGKTYEEESDSAPQSGQVTRPQLHEMIKEDRLSHPEHWTIPQHIS